jgi:hypothetical protein
MHGRSSVPTWSRRLARCSHLRAEDEAAYLPPNMSGSRLPSVFQKDSDHTLPESEKAGNDASLEKRTM